MKSEDASSAEDAGALVHPESPSPPGSTPPHVPDHDLLRCIGRGSYGEVWLARSILGEFRAVKVIHRRAFGDNRPFDREFEGLQHYEPISRSHESQVQILHVGRDDDAGYFYYVMELADCAEGEEEKGGKGEEANNVNAASSPPFPSAPLPLFSAASYTPRTLRSELERHTRLPIAQCLEIGLALTTALEHLHGHGLVHRDIKPSNIIFVRGRPKLADIGLVTDAGDAASIVGTEGYLAPEGPGSPQADLYSLGKVLYEISTGRDRRHFPDLPLDLAVAAGVPPAVEPGVPPGGSGVGSDKPFENSRPGPGGKMPPSTAGGTPAATFTAAARTGLLELNEILLKACARDTRQRYQTAEEMRGDLELLQRGESVRRKRAAKRQLAFAKAVGMATVAIALLFSTVGLFSSRQSEQRRIRRQQAHQLLLEGRKHADRLTKEEFSKAVELYHQAIALDPTYPVLYVGLCETYSSVSGWHLRPREAMAQAKWAITKALELDSSSAPAHAWMGVIKQCYDWDWAGAEGECKRAIELAPRDTIGYYGFANFLAWMGRFDEAEAQRTQGRRFAQGPSHRDDYDAGLLLFFRHRYDESMAVARAALALDTNSVLNHSLLLDCFLKTGRYPEAIAEVQTSRALDDSPWPISELGHIYGLMGQTNDARQCLTELERLSPQRFVSRYFFGFIHLGLGEKESALDCLEEAYEERFGWLGNLKVDPLWDGLRDEPRFKELLKKLGLEN